MTAAPASQLCVVNACLCAVVPTGHVGRVLIAFPMDCLRVVGGKQLYPTRAEICTREPFFCSFVHLGVTSVRICRNGPTHTDHSVRKKSDTERAALRQTLEAGTVAIAIPLALAVRLSISLALAARLALVLAVQLAIALALALAVQLAVLLALVLRLALALSVQLALALVLAVPIAVAVHIAVAVLLAHGLALGLAVQLALVVRIPVWLVLAVAVAMHSGVVLAVMFLPADASEHAQYVRKGNHRLGGSGPTDQIGPCKGVPTRCSS